MSDKNSSTSGGVSFAGLLCIAFIVLKLCKVIDWSWWLVTSPIWIPLALVIGIGLIILPFYIYGKLKKRRKIKKSIELLREPTSKWQQRIEAMQAIKSKTK
jgi:hypothetical protein